MIIPSDIAAVLTKEEVDTLVKFYGTDFYKPYLNRLKEKYAKLLKVLKD